ncbi:MAG: M23 family metallopeptidase [Desulfobulbaceae bacterium]|nr:M23 family metallopeptidase [Desulfobulbaceae bacterium]
MVFGQATFNFLTLFNEQLESGNSGISFAPPRGWIFHRGMRFGATHTWWGEGKKRPVPHEGLDLLHYLNREGTTSTLTSQVRLITPLGGEVATVSRDFLGKSVWLRHPVIRDKGKHLYSVYAHIAPATTIRVGGKVEPGDTVGTITRGNSAVGVPDHLHLSLFWAVASLDAQLLDWPRFAFLPEVRLIDPMQTIHLHPR